MKRSLLIFFMIASLLLCGCQVAPTDPLESIPETEPLESGSRPLEEASSEKPVKTMPDPFLTSSLKGFGAASVITLKNLPVNKAVQQIDFYENEGNLYVFVTQRSKSTVYLSRHLVNPQTGRTTLMDSVELHGYGHGESMEISFHQGVLYLFVTSGANPLNSYYWGTQITRLKYEGGAITEEKHLTGMESITSNGAPMFEDAAPYRVNFGLDDEADLLVAYVRASKGDSEEGILHRLSCYTLSAIHSALDAATQSVSIAELCHKLVATMENTTTEQICSNGSFQGIEVAPDGTIYLTGGSDDNMPQLSVFRQNGGVISRESVTNIDFLSSRVLGAWDFKTSTHYYEIESIKYYQGALYCVFNPAGDLRQSFTEIYLLLNQ